MTRGVTYIGLLSLAALIGCGFAFSPERVSPLEPAAKTKSVSVDRGANRGTNKRAESRLEVELPTRLSESYVLSLDIAPEQTAERFLMAHSGFAKDGPVTRAKIFGHARFQQALEQGKLLNYIFVHDVNHDMKITREEFKALASVSISANKALGAAPLFQFDHNQDDVISRGEAADYSREIYALHSKQDIRPMEDYLMLFDLNVDGVVSRTEMHVSLKPYLRGKTIEHGGGGDGALP